MKKTIFTTAALSLMLGFASCSNELETPIVSVEEGTPTNMGIAFTVPANTKPGTRATTDDNATDAEAAFKFVDVFVYNPNTGIQVKHARIPSSEFTGPEAGSNADEWTMKKTSAKIATTTGEKTILLGVNLSSTMSNALIGVPMSAFMTVAQEVTIASVTGDADGFAMFSTAPVTLTLVADAEQNNPTIQVQRLVAKVTVQKSASMTVSAAGTIDNLMFVLNNTNKKTFFVQPNDKKDHNWDVTPAGDLNDGNLDFVAVNEASVVVKQLNPKYALENTTRDYLMGQITRATVRGTFIPSEVKVYANGSSNADGYADQAVTATTPATFYSVVYNGGADRAYFFNQAVANAFAADNSAMVVTYTDGFNYWDMFLNPENVSGPYDVLRNDFYRCNITRIIGPGRATPEVTDPTIPPAQATDLFVNIDILYWSPIQHDYVLEP